jgi:hypothetical protein
MSIVTDRSLQLRKAGADAAAMSIARNEVQEGKFIAKALPNWPVFPEAMRPGAYRGRRLE